jgi:hypothetical protein
MNDIKFDRNKLQAEYVDRILEGMDMDTLVAIVQDTLNDDFDLMGDEDLIAEVSVNYPDLLEE